MAVILLKDGASLVTYCSQDLKYQVIQFMKSKGLTHWWEIAIIHTGSSARMFSKKVIVTWKPLLWFVKGTKPKTFEFIKDSVESQPPDKTLHPWVQSPVEAEHVISKLTIQNDVVLDCLMGTGTTGIAALNLKRRFFGIEIDPKVYQIARARIRALF
jgi:DNA modification methylase